MDESAVPRATLRPRRRIGLTWLLPLAAAGVAVWAGWHAWGRTGAVIALRFEQGHGLRVGDTLRHRGIAVGRVETVELGPELDGVRVELRLAKNAAELAREGSLFWIVRPKIGWGGIAGLDTLAGARYIDVLAGTGPTTAEFTGLEDTPIAALCPPGGLEIVINAGARGGIRPGSPLMYRQLAVGRVISTALASDGAAVDIRCYIDPPFAPLVRQRTVFWQDSGVTLRLGLREGLRVGFDSPETLLSGGVALATPPDAGEPVNTGHRFPLHLEHLEEWLEWRPAVPVGPTLGGERLPRPVRATLSWRKQEWLQRSRSKHGWTLPIDGGLLGPTGLMQPDGPAKESSLELEVAGGRYPMAGPPVWQGGGLALLRLELPAEVASTAWPRGRMRAPRGPEDCLLVGDAGGDPVAVDEGRLAAGDGGWTIDASVPLDASWHGAAVVARRDGTLIGMLLADQGRPRVAPLPDPTTMPVSPAK